MVGDEDLRFERRMAVCVVICDSGCVLHSYGKGILSLSYSWL